MGYKMEADKERLILLLQYLVKHNKEHGRALRELAIEEKA